MAPATSILNEISGALDSLAHAIRDAGQGNPEHMLTVHGWDQPVMTYNDFAEIIVHSKERLASVAAEDVSDVDLQRLQHMPSKIEHIRAHANHAWGNPRALYYMFRATLDLLFLVLDKYIPTATKIEDLKGRLPAEQLKELSRIERGIKLIQGRTGDLEAKIEMINSAHDAANALPIDMQMLEETKKNFEESKRRVEAFLAHLQVVRTTADGTGKDLEEIYNKAEAIMQKANTAYSAATTVGLGEAFSNRAEALSKNVWIMMFVLALVLGGGAFITYQRVEFVHKLMLMPNVSQSILWINVTFTALSVSAPIWFAWLLTRQIGQRFRLAEDYSYKAAVAKAYEGYRAEAAQIDSRLAERLFSIALDKLEEAPLKLVEGESPGSPLHDPATHKLRWLLPKTKTRARVNTPVQQPDTEDEES